MGGGGSLIYSDQDCIVHVCRLIKSYLHCLPLFTTVKPIPRRVDVACYNETYQRKLETFTKRVSLSLVLICTGHAWLDIVMQNAD